MESEQVELIQNQRVEQRLPGGGRNEEVLVEGHELLLALSKFQGSTVVNNAILYT